MGGLRAPMGKKGKKGKAKKADGYPIEYGIPGDPAITSEKTEKVKYSQKMLKSLERTLELKERYAHESTAQEEELRQEVREMEKEFADEQKTTFAVTADMARQYKAL